MFFNVEYDTGAAIAGYIVPDGVSGSLDLIISSNGENIFEFSANKLIASLVHSGRHSTGLCGFLVTNEQITNLETVYELEIRKREDNMLIYRRNLSTLIQKKILRLETQMIPQWRMDRFFEQKFQYYLNNIENYGRETTTQLFLLNGINSEYISGRILMRNYAYYTENNFECITLIQDPYEELAERLFVFQQLKKASLPHLGGRESANFRPAIDFVENISLTDEKSILSAFKVMPEDVASILSDPLVRQLTTTAPGEGVARNATASALDVLGSFAVIGLHDQSEQYLAACAELLGVNYNELPPVPKFSQVSILADILRQSKHVGYLIEKDRELYQLVTNAFIKADRSEL
jgi:hypothetical protein